MITLFLFRRLRFTAGPVMLFFTLVGYAAQSPAPHLTAQRDAYTAFKAGNFGAALARLGETIQRTPRAPHEDLQLGQCLAEICSWLQNEGERTRAREVSMLALSKLDRPQGRMNARDAAAVLMICGRLLEHIQGDLQSAKSMYEQVLILQPANSIARQRLGHLNSTAAHIEAKAAANALLQERARTTKR